MPLYNKVFGCYGIVVFMLSVCLRRFSHLLSDAEGGEYGLENLGGGDGAGYGREVVDGFT